MTQLTRLMVLAAIALQFSMAAARAEELSKTELAKLAQNPIANLIHVSQVADTRQEPAPR